MSKTLFLVISILCCLLSKAQKNIVYNDKILSFTVLVDSTLAPDSVNYFCVVKSITVARIKDNKRIQTLIPQENDPICGLPNDEIFIIEDVNFDGYNDIRLIKFLPAAPNIPYYYWTFNPNTKKFQRQKALEFITSPDFDHKNKLIYSFWRGSCCDHGLSTYKYINGKPTLIKEVEVKEEDGNIITTEKKLINGKMKLIKRSVEKAQEE